MPHPFTWAPAEQERHASTDEVEIPGKPEFPAGKLITALCGRQVVTADAGEVEWLWPTCPSCDDETRRIVGVPTRAECEAIA